MSSGGKKTTKAAIKITALNIRGNSKDRKWFKLNQIMNERRAGIMIVGEAHLSDVCLAAVERTFARQLEIRFSRDPRTPNANGVAIVLSKSTLKVDDLQTWEIVPGRALLLQTKRHDDSDLSILGVYAPNPPAENATFWEDIRKWFESHPGIRKPDMMGGDTNVVVLEVVNWSRDIIRLPARNVSHDQSLSCLCTLSRSAATPLGSNLQQVMGL
ncbi:hypothetical protein B0H13DRAFT_1705884 [Mycena leptocephala]|nr:hypothetical protein B0H13DRAFT_1705884 [Mycena leptocephala]